MKTLIIYSITLIFLLAGCSSEEHQHENNSVKSEYYCPMHPEVTSDKPSVCPICHMDLVKKGDDETSHFDDLDGVLKIGERRQILANVQTVKVAEEEIIKNVRSFSYLDFAEPFQKTITARFNGRIEKLFINQTGAVIKKGDPLFEIYSPDLVQAQNEFLVALNNNRPLVFMTGSSDNKEVSPLLDAAKKKLLLFGFTENQIEKLTKTSSISHSVIYYSPFSGTVIEKKIQEGIYVNEGSVLFEISDLSTLWNIAEIFEDDLPFVKKGTKAELIINSAPGRKFNGTVNFIYPVVNPQTRTIKIRSEFRSDNILMPNMYGETIFTGSLGKGLTIPVDAVINSGNERIVWLKVSENTFEARLIKTGVKFNNKYQVFAGLQHNDEIVLSGGYLIDSESQLRGNSAPSSIHDHSSVVTKEKDNSNLIFNAVCPILGGKIDPKTPTVDYKGKKIGFCCPGCDEEFLSDPDKYMENLSSDGKSFLDKH